MKMDSYRTTYRIHHIHAMTRCFECRVQTRYARRRRSGIRQNKAWSGQFFHSAP